MGSKTLNHLKKVALDSNIFSYQLHQDPTFGLFTKQIFDNLSLHKIEAVTSILTVAEVLSVKAKPSRIKQLEQLLLRTPNLVIYDIDHSIAIETAKIRRDYGFRTPDAIQLATALQSKAKAFITNDHKLKKFKKIKVVLITETT